MRYAFIDVQNTETTTQKVLGFELDHARLFSYLKERWECEEVFFYPGIQHDDNERKAIFEELAHAGAIVRPKEYFVYQNKDKFIERSCSFCNKTNTYSVPMGKTWKCNCDVEMTIDILDHAKDGVELLIFSGDGDFEFLIEREHFKMDQKLPSLLVHKNKKGEGLF